MNELELLRASLMWIVFFSLLAFEHLDGIRSALPNRWRRRRDNVLLLLVGTLGLRSLLAVTVVSAAYWAQTNNFGLLNWAEVQLVLAIPITLVFLDLILFLQHLVL